jgi:hypothetical protein
MVCSCLSDSNEKIVLFSCFVADKLVPDDDIDDDLQMEKGVPVEVLQVHRSRARQDRVRGHVAEAHPG